jgi:hypothetical protein
MALLNGILLFNARYKVPAFKFYILVNIFLRSRKGGRKEGRTAGRKEENKDGRKGKKEDTFGKVRFHLSSQLA